MINHSGWVKLPRDVLNDPLLNKDPEYLTLWIHLLCSAVFEPTPALLGGKRVVLQPGQLTTGRKQLALNSGISESKVERILKVFETGQLIEQQSTSRNRLISILSWSEHQESEQQNGRQSNNERTATEQQSNTLKEIKNIRTKNIGADKPPTTRFVKPTFEQVAEYVASRNSRVDPQEFIDFYEAKGWMIGKSPMKDWKAACRNAEKWERWGSSPAAPSGRGIARIVMDENGEECAVFD